MTKRQTSELKTTRRFLPIWICQRSFLKNLMVRRCLRNWLSFLMNYLCIHMLLVLQCCLSISLSATLYPYSLDWIEGTPPSHVELSTTDNTTSVWWSITLTLSCPWGQTFGNANMLVLQCVVNERFPKLFDLLEHGTDVRITWWLLLFNGSTLHDCRAWFYLIGTWIGDPRSLYHFRYRI